MNQTFNINRWWLLVTRHWIENRKRYLLSLLAMPGLLLAWFGFSLVIGGHHPVQENIQYITYEGGLYIAGSIYASMLFSDLGSRPRAINFLSVPASHFEKLLCAILYGVVLFFFLYTLAFYVADIPMVKIGNALGYERFKTDHFTDEIFVGDRVFNVFVYNERFHNEGFFYFFIAYFPVQSVFLLGSVYFARYSFIKTTIALLLLWLLFFIYIRVLYPADWYWHNLVEWSRYNKNGEMNVIRLSPWIENFLGYLFKYSIPVILWVITYFRLKEKEI